MWNSIALRAHHGEEDVQHKVAGGAIYKGDARTLKNVSEEVCSDGPHHHVNPQGGTHGEPEGVQKLPHQASVSTGELYASVRV